jgi:hypothetical protein
MKNWDTSDWKAHIVQACISCKNVVVLTTEPEILQEKEQMTNLFLPTVCVLCEKGGRMAIGFGKSGIGSATALWTSLLIGYKIEGFS